MKRIAVIENGKVINVIISENLAAARMLLPEYELVVETGATGPAYIGQPYLNDRFVPIPEDTTWTFDEVAWAWIPPVPYPKDGKPYYWDKEAQNWAELAMIEFPNNEN